jgi:hypothetical protein
MSPRRGRKARSEPPIDERSFSSRESVRADLVPYSALPAETGPMWAPDRISVWPLEGGRFGIDAHYEGRTGTERAEVQVRRLAGSGLQASAQWEQSGAAVRLGPLSHGAVWLALEAFLGKPLVEP